MAKQSKKAKSNVVTTKARAGGFGVKKAEPTLEEVIAGFPNRLPSDTNAACPCGTIPYRECCQPYHEGKKDPETPEQVLRSRYCAFAYRLPEYIIRTTDEENIDYTTDKIKWAKKLNKGMYDEYDFRGLEIAEVKDGKDDGEKFIEFLLSFYRIDKRTKLRVLGQTEPLVFKERSRFVRTGPNDSWLYASGDVMDR